MRKNPFKYSPTLGIRIPRTLEIYHRLILGDARRFKAMTVALTTLPDNQYGGRPT